MPDLTQLFVLAILVFIFISLYREYFRPPTTFFIAIVLLSVAGILTPSQALSGFADEQIAVIILLLVIASIIKKASVIDLLFERLFRSAKTYSGFLLRMMVYVSGSSAFLNNTPIVATLIPYVTDWGKRNNIAPSKLLIPLSYAAILGGTATLIGTSTNLIVKQMMIDSGLEGFSIFDFTYVGAPLIVIGIVYLVFAAPRLLPEKQDILDKFSESSREYIVETRIKGDSPLIGLTIEEANLRHLKTLYLVEIIRNERRIAAVSPEEILVEGDILIFAGEVDSITEIYDLGIGLDFPQVDNIESDSNLKVNEAVVPQNSQLIGNRVKETNFRATYDAAIIAIHRNGERLSQKIGEIVLKPGDLLLLVTGEDFANRTRDTQNIYVISKVRDLENINLFKVYTIGIGTIAAIASAAIGIISLFKALLILLSVIAIMRIVTLTEIKNSLDFNVVFIAAFAIAISKAIQGTGTADYLATNFLYLFEGLGPVGVLFGIYIVTNLMTEFVTNVRLLLSFSP
jgi:di/tricarboxylate transporter